jgi:hypothetical protein
MLKATVLKSIWLVSLQEQNCIALDQRFVWPLTCRAHFPPLLMLPLLLSALRHLFGFSACTWGVLSDGSPEI